MSLGEKSGLAINGNGFFIILLLSIVGSYLPNVASFNSIKYAPNPGYSLIISKSYVVFTTIVAIFLFRSSLTLKSVIAIAIIICFSALITIGKTINGKGVKNIWIPLAFAAFFGWGILSIGSKYVFTIGISVTQRLFYLSVFITIFALFDIYIRKSRVKDLNLPKIALMAFIGIFFSLFNFFMFTAIDKAPNIGYVNAINAGSISALTVFSALFFKDEFTLKKFVGVLGVTGGLFLLVV